MSSPARSFPLGANSLDGENHYFFEGDGWKNQAAKRSFAQSSFGYFSSKKSNASSRV